MISDFPRFHEQARLASAVLGAEDSARRTRSVPRSRRPTALTPPRVQVTRFVLTLNLRAMVAKPKSKWRSKTDTSLTWDR
jgi:hypothetical protein